MRDHAIIFVLYDGITNSVFESQVLGLLKQLKKKYMHHRFILISFEHEANPKLPFLEPWLQCVILKKNIFFGTYSLLPAVFRLKNILKDMSIHTLIARGPLAGYLALQALSYAKIYKKCIIQARGLLAHEYLYAHQNDWLPFKIMHYARAYQFRKLEQKVYRSNKNIRVHIEVVSKALATFLIKNCNAAKKNMQLATADIPNPVAKSFLKYWRIIIRKQLGICKNSFLYCYNGSAKAWQCPEETISFFCQQYKKNKNARLLILTQDQSIFIDIIQTNKLPQDAYRILTVPHQDVFKYLSASDSGILLRKKNILNWVSRPTKLLEYQATRLHIIHNKTIELLA